MVQVTQVCVKVAVVVEQIVSIIIIVVVVVVRSGSIVIIIVVVVVVAFEVEVGVKSAFCVSGLGTGDFVVAKGRVAVLVGVPAFVFDIKLGVLKAPGFVQVDLRVLRGTVVAVVDVVVAVVEVDVDVGVGVVVGESPLGKIGLWFVVKWMLLIFVVVVVAIVVGIIVVVAVVVVEAALV